MNKNDESDYELSHLYSKKNAAYDKKVRICHNDMIILVESLIDYHLLYLESYNQAVASDSSALTILNIKHRMDKIESLKHKLALSCGYYDRKCKTTRDEGVGHDAITASAIKSNYYKV